MGVTQKNVLLSWALLFLPASWLPQDEQFAFIRLFCHEVVHHQLNPLELRVQLASSPLNRVCQVFGPSTVKMVKTESCAEGGQFCSDYTEHMVPKLEVYGGNLKTFEILTREVLECCKQRWMDNSDFQKNRRLVEKQTVKDRLMKTFSQ